jgi:hypothetical protein
VFPAAWHGDLHGLESISQDRLARGLLTRMAELERAGRLDPFLEELHRDDELDDRTKRLLTELAADRTFLQAVDDYVRRTAVLH